MLYREAGQFKSTYAEDQRIFPIRQDRIGFWLLMLVAFVVIPAIGDQYWLGAMLTPFLIFALAALGLNILTGYAGQLSLGTAAFMAVGAFMAYNFELRIPGMPILVSFALGGLCAAVVGIVFGLPSLRIKGFYLAVATLACQFFVLWALQHFGRDHCRADRHPRLRVPQRGEQVPADARRRLGNGAPREEPDAVGDGARVHGGARHGRGGERDRHPDHANQAARIRDQLVLL